MSIKKFFFLILMFSFKPALKADGYRCWSDHGQLRVKIYNHTSAQTGGTRAPAVMVLSNPSVSDEEGHTIAVFENDNIERADNIYTGRVDLRFREIAKQPQASIGPHRLADLSHVSVKPKGEVLSPAPRVGHAGAIFRSVLQLKFRDGTYVNYWFKCRYYKVHDPCNRRFPAPPPSAFRKQAIL